MNATIITGVSILVLLVGGLLFFKGEMAEQANDETVRVAYCPTMKPFAEQIANTNKNVLLLEQSSSAQALQELKNQNIDVALIGRKAEQSEIQSVNERILKEGYTLITTTKTFIQEKELANINIHTAIAEDIAKQLLPYSEIQFYTTTQEAVHTGLQEAVLIDWKEYKEEYELLVVMKGTEKMVQFRIPVLYSNKYDLKKIKVEI